MAWKYTIPCYSINGRDFFAVVAMLFFHLMEKTLAGRWR
jgi:hypothetical protein